MQRLHGRFKRPWAAVGFGCLVVLCLLPAGSTALVAGGDPAAALFENFGVIKMAGLAPPLDVVLTDLSGRPRRVSEFAGTVVLLNFWTTWCAECRVEMPSLEKLHRRFDGRGLTLLAINLKESRQTVADFFDNRRLTFPSLLDSDGNVGLRFGVRSIPTTFIIDKNGSLIGKIIGGRRWNGREAVALFEHLLTRAGSSPRP